VPVHYVRVDWSTHEAKLRQIRERVFVVERGLTHDAEFDGLDEESEHFLAMNEAGQALGTVRLQKDGRIGRIAVLPEHRRRGIGRQLLNDVATGATNLGLRRVFVQIEPDADAFFRAAGFRTANASSDENLPYIELELVLSIPFQPPHHAVAPSLPNRDPPFEESRPYRLVHFSSEYDCRAAVCNLLANARRTVVLLSPSLDPKLFAGDECLASVSAFARRSRHTRVLILVEDTKAIAASGHSLLELARRLPSKVLIRRLPDDREPPKNSYMVVDREAVWVMPDLDAPVGWTNQHDRMEARRLADEFMWLFERSSEDPELRLLSL
jgi:N-acetylglutamate synthase-like GNAT family acetyltransferase